MSISTAREKYSPEGYVALDIGDYRAYYGDETKHLTDEQLFDLVMGTEDDLEADEWKALFKQSKIDLGK